MPVNVRLISITFNQPGFVPPQPPFPFHGAPFPPGLMPMPGPGPGPFPGLPPGMMPPPPPPLPGLSATVTIQIDSDHGSMSVPFTVPYNPPDLTGVHNAAVQAATAFFNEITQMLQRA